MSANEPERFREAQATAEATTETEVLLPLNEPTVTAEPLLPRSAGTRAASYRRARTRPSLGGRGLASIWSGCLAVVAAGGVKAFCWVAA